MVEKYDFSGYATRVNIRCRDGRTILPGAFADCDGKRVPLVWQHQHGEPENVLGHCLLETRPDGVYTYASFNNTERANIAKTQVLHEDIRALSIYANDLVQDDSKNVSYGSIREVSLVLAGANPGAFIENVIRHGDIMEDEATIYIEDEDAELIHAYSIEYDDVKKTEPSKDKTVAQIIETMDEEQTAVMYHLIGKALEGLPADNQPNEAAQADPEQGETIVHKNVFENDPKAMTGAKVISEDDKNKLFHDAMDDAKAGRNTFREAVLAHAGTYGIDNIELLFPDAKTIESTPEFISRRMEWVNDVLGGVRKTPFSRIKMLQADITADEARAKGYVKGDRKKEEVFKLLSRSTEPKTVYKKQKLDKDDITDITNFDVVAWLWAEMKMMLEEELARAILVGDGRQVDDPDKIDEDKIRPIWKDDELYTHKIVLPAASTPDAVIEGIIRSRKFYKGSGNPALFIGTDLLTDMLMLKDKMDRYMYPTLNELQTRLRVSKIVEVEQLDGLNRVDEDSKTLNFVAMMVNLRDYAVGTDRGGEITRYDQFDIDFNQWKYLIETRMSGSLTKVKSAVVIEKASA